MASNPTPPARTSLFATPVALLLGVAFVLCFYFATVPIVDPRAGGNGLWVALLAVSALAIPVAGFWRNQAFFREAPVRARTRAAALLIAETALYLSVLFVFSNITAGGEEESSVREKTATLINTGAELQRAVEAKMAETRSLARIGKAVSVQTSGTIAETLLGTDGAVILYDDQMRALAAMVPSAREKLLDWQLEGFPARIFPAHWQARAGTTLDQNAAGSPIEHSQQLLAPADQLQHEISAEAKKRGTTRNVVPARLLQPAGLIDFGYVDPDGWFALYSDRHGIFMLFEPELRTDGLVHWQCRVHPAEAQVPGCATGRR